MKSSHRLRLRTEHLAELTPANLRVVVGGTEHTDTGAACLAEMVTKAVATVVAPETSTGAHCTTECAVHTIA